jgi:hypothetical protein
VVDNKKNGYVKTTIEFMTIFFEECIKRNIPGEDHEGRNNLLVELIEKHPEHIMQMCLTDRDDKQIIKDLSRDYRIIQIKKDNKC